MRALPFVLACASLATACGVPEEGPWMEPGADCQSCHSATGRVSDIPWNASGTVFADATASAAGVAGATVEATDANGTVWAFTTNGAGNFYTKEAIVFPAKV